MRRKHSKDREFDQNQRLKYENQKLKRQISSLRKQLARIDISRYEHIQDMLQEYDEQEVQDRIAKEKEQLKQKWKCWDCTEGYLKLIILDRRDGLKYFRKCNNCKKQTGVKNFTPDIEGFKYEEGS